MDAEADRTARAAFESGVAYLNEGDLEGAGRLFSEAARLGHSEAMYQLGLTLRRLGEKEGENFSAEAGYWWRKASELGHVKAMFNLGLLLAREEKDKTGARNLWLKAATAGMPEAMYNLGVLEKEAGSFGRAREWWKLAAGKGDPASMEALAELNRKEGRAEEREKWLLQAAQHGAVEAMVLVAIMLKSRGEIEKASALWAEVSRVEPVIPLILREAYESGSWFPLGLSVQEWRWAGPRIIGDRVPGRPQSRYLA